MAEEQKKETSNYLNSFIDFIFSDDERRWLILIFIFGFILRFIAVMNNSPVADEMVHGSHALGISTLRPLSTITQGPIWFYLTDISYRIFGVHLWSGRGLSLLFGSFSILLVYLVSHLFFDKKVSLVAAFLFAISPFQIMWARIYMDESLLFFILLATYLFLRDYRTKGYITPLSALFLGIGILIKIISGVFIIVFSLFVLINIYNNRKDNKLFKKSIKNAVYFFIIILISLIPLLAYNYFLYKSKGILDLPFAMYLGVNTQVYQGSGLAHGSGFPIGQLPGNLKVILFDYFIKDELILFILFILGLIIFIREIKKNAFEKAFILTLFGFSLIAIAASILLNTHYTYFVAIFAMIGAPVIPLIARKISARHVKNTVIVILIAIAIFNIYHMWDVLSSKSATEKLRDFAISNIKDTDLVIVDSRIYRGNTAWMFNDKAYLDASILSSAIQYLNSLNGTAASVHTYFVECAIDDCGWGNIKDSPDVNSSMEMLVDTFKNLSKNSFAIKGGGKDSQEYDSSKLDQYIVYDTYVALNPQIIYLAQQNHNFFFYEIPRNKNPEKAFDYYIVDGASGDLLNFIAYTVLYLLIALAALSPIYVIYILYKIKH
ncbi:glycosyltransferase family 39 protein [Candidatus Pacearchaeota archaeon]|nr:glycosyltransferase family 39 protein [Candidatus Pacearchaeota archaeon]